MRVSSYLIVCPLEGRSTALLAHGITGALDKVPNQLGEILLTYRGQELPNGLVAESDAHVLFSRGHLTDLTAIEERDRLIEISGRIRARGLAQKVPSIAFVPTYQCNLRCAYCFQPHKAHAGHGKFVALLSDEQIDAAFEIIDQYAIPGSLAADVGLLTDAPAKAGRCRKHAAIGEIGLFGGEPLMRRNLPAIERIAEKARERDATLWAITNGVELDYFIHLLGPEPGQLAELQVTVDGTADRHNSRRRGPSLLATFDDVISNIGKALSRSVTLNVRMNTDQQNAQDIQPLAQFFASQGWADLPNFSFHCAVVTSDKAPQPSWGELVELTSAASDRGLKVQSYEHSAREFLMSCLNGTGKELPHFKTANCAAEQGQLMFDCFGDVYGCWEDVGFDEHRIGTYDAQGLELDGDNVRRWFGRHPGTLDACSECPYALIHTSGCGAQARQATGTIMQNECAGFQAYFPKSLGRAFSSLEARLKSTMEKENV